MFSIHNYQHIASLVPPWLSLNQVVRVPVAEYSAIHAQASKHVQKQKNGTEQGDTHAITANNGVDSDAHVAPAPAFEKKKKQKQKTATGSHQQDKSNQSDQHTAMASSLNVDETQTSLLMSAAGLSRSPFMFMPAPTTFSYYPQVSAPVYPGVVPTASNFSTISISKSGHRTGKMTVTGPIWHWS